MSNKAKLAGIKKRMATRPTPPDPVQEWRETLIGVAKVYGDAGDVEKYKAMTDDEIKAEWARIPEQLDKIYSMTDEQLEAFLNENPAERAALQRIDDEQLQRYVEDGIAEAKRK